MQVDIILPIRDNQQKKNIQEQLKQEMPDLQQAQLKVSYLTRLIPGNTTGQNNQRMLRQYYEQMRSAHNQDPFGIFYFQIPQSPGYTNITNYSERRYDYIRRIGGSIGGPQKTEEMDVSLPDGGNFLRITFRHKSFEECRFLMSMPEINQPSGTGNSAGKQNTNMFFTDQ